MIKALATISLHLQTGTWRIISFTSIYPEWGGSTLVPGQPKGNQSWIFIGRTDAETETPIFWLPDAKSWLIRKDPNAGKNWRMEEKEMTEDEMVGWHHQLDGHEFQQTPGDGEGQGSLACCSPWVSREWTWLSHWKTTTRGPCRGTLALLFLTVGRKKWQTALWGRGGGKCTLLPLKEKESLQFWMENYLNLEHMETPNNS